MRRGFVKRVIFYILGLLLLAFGVALTPKANLGVAAISSIAFAGSMITPLTFGMCMTIFQIFCVCAQLVLKRRMTVKLALQLPVSYAFGFLIDFFSNLLVFPPPGIGRGILLMTAGILIIALALRIHFGASLMLMPPDALVRDLGEIIGWPLSRTKFVFDTSVVALSAASTLVIMGDAFIAVGLGTIMSMLLVGPAIGFYQKVFPFFDVPCGDFQTP